MKRTQILFSLFLSIAGCSALTHVIWPTAVACAGSISGTLVTEVEALLAGPSDPTSQLEQFGLTYGADTIICILQQIVATYGQQPTASSMYGDAADIRAVRARAFLAAKHIQAPVAAAQKPPLSSSPASILAPHFELIPGGE